MNTPPAINSDAKPEKHKFVDHSCSRGSMIRLERAAMPLLDDDQVLRLRSRIEHCSWCAHQIIFNNYCRQCDEYFEYGHIKQCPHGEAERKHAEHRTY